MVRKIRAKLVLRLRAEGFSGRQIAAQGMSRHSVAEVFEAADREGVDWDDIADLDEAAVYARLFPGRGEHESVHAQPDWQVVHRELARVGVTLKLLHGEYVDRCHAEGATAMGYDRFCKTYQHHVLVAGASSAATSLICFSFSAGHRLCNGRPRWGRHQSRVCLNVAQVVSLPGSTPS